MFRLTREIRFAVNEGEDDQYARRPSNSFAGFPSLTGMGHYFIVRATLAGQLEADTSYLRNIRDIDRAVRRDLIPLATAFVRRGRFGGGGLLVSRMFDVLKDAWAPAALVELRLLLTPFLHLTVSASENPMVRLSHMFEFCASHRLHNPALNEEENRLAFGKCNNPHGHGHNYRLQVTLLGKPDSAGLIMPMPAFEEIVSSNVIDKFDHRNLNIEIPEFASLIPTVENIAKVIYRTLKPHFQDAVLASVTVWETEKTWCEYSE